MILTLLLSFCVSCGQIGFGPPEREIEKIYNPAETMYKGLLAGKIRRSQGNWSNVIRQFKKVVKNHSKSRFADDAQYRIGASYIQANGIIEDAPQKAIEAFERLMKRYPDSEFVDDANYWKAHAYSLKEDHERAIVEYEEFVSKYPQSELYKDALNRIKEYGPSADEQKKDQTKTPPPPVAQKKDENPPEKPTQQANKEIAPATKADVAKPKEAAPIKKPEVEKQQEDSREISYVLGIRTYSLQGSTRVVIDLTGPVKHKIGELAGPDRIFVDIQIASMTPPQKTIQINDKFIKRIRAAQFNETTVRIVLDVERNQNYNVVRLTDPDRITIDVSGSDALPMTSLPPDESESIPLVKQLGLKVRTIVIDPGHGGKDPGAVSRNGLQEKGVVLDVAKRLVSLLESKGAYQVHMTRETDVFIPLKDRTNFANQKKADIFISVHINSCERPGARGIETYYLSLASDEDARMTAAMENASSGRTVSDLSNMLRYILRGAKVDESRELARTVQSQLSQTTGTNDRGIKRAPFVVLIGAEAPSILVELGFISNIQDENLLRSAAYRDKLARALMKAVENYVKIIDQAS